MTPLQPNEDRIEGRWLEIDGKLVADDATRRINQLITLNLTKVATAEGGWDTLYIDNRDGRKWELTYPNGEWHGGGPPTLALVSEVYVQRKYGR